MRIQHNIVAMNAYRNYTNNVSAMKKNLEKLSSGYKINRAGDDAAGLAISEKMRAQITGLQTAQKNAKDGISLIQTAEGALTEVHDMLNRMVTLATQSANGTYDNETDRVQLQKEVDQLRSEINRIADSSNFNGIKLLDGSLDGGVNVTASKFEYSANSTIAEGLLPKVGTTLGADTVLHSDAASGGGTTFSVDLHNVGYNTNQTTASKKFELAVGTDFKVEIDVDTGSTAKVWTGEDIANAVISVINGTAVTGVTVTDGTGSPVTSGGKVQIGGQEFEVTKSDAGDDRLVFTQVNAPADQSEQVDGKMAVVIQNAIVSGSATVGGSFAAGTPATNQAVTITGTASGKQVDWATNTTSIDLSNLSDGDTLEFTIDGQTFDVTLSTSAVTAGDKKVQFYASAGQNPNAVLTAIEAEVNRQITAYNTSKASGTTTYNDISAFAWGNMTAGTPVALSTAGATATLTSQTYTAGTGTPDADSGQTLVDYNWQTTDVKNVSAGDTPRLASTQFELTSNMAVDGNYVKIGDDTYTFTTDKDKEGKDGYVYIIDDATGNTASLGTIAQRLTDAAGNNATYTVGVAGSTAISLVEIEGQKNYDLSTKDGILESLGYGKASQGNGKSLTLQIGESADDYNKLAVNVRDMHTTSLGIGDINIGTQAGAADAIDKIKAAINMVSDVRGTLGATQNRLDHTINNLSVMTENIQDAESTIRDTDVAEEMMAYTKNNILIQSAQAMLAQANQLPQGVLQLLQ